MKRTYYKKVEKNEVDGFHTIEQLQKIFRIKDDKCRTIKEAFGENLVIIDDTISLESKYLVKRLGFVPTEPFMTKAEVMKMLGITELQFRKLLRKKLLPVVKISNARATTMLFLKRDVENLNQTIVRYNNSAELLIAHNNKFKWMLGVILDYDDKHSNLIGTHKRHLAVMKLYLLEGMHADDIATALSISVQRVRQLLDAGIKGIDRFFGVIESEFKESKGLQETIKKLQTENNELKVKNDYLEKFIKTTPLDENSLSNTLNADLYHLISNLQISELGISVRLTNCLAKAKNLPPMYLPADKADTLKFKWLLEVPLDALYKIPSFGKITNNEVRQLLFSHGFIPNGLRGKVTITPDNILSHVHDNSLAMEFYKSKREQVYKSLNN